MSDELLQQVLVALIDARASLAPYAVNTEKIEDAIALLEGVKMRHEKKNTQHGRSIPW